MKRIFGILLYSLMGGFCIGLGGTVFLRLKDAFPGGHVEDGESIYASAIRETKEETGLTVSDLEQVGIIHMYTPESQE